MEKTPPKLQFHHNWNNGKLDNSSFTTIRLLNNSRYFRGAIFDIVLVDKGKEINKGKAQVHVVYKTKLHDLQDYQCLMDTGYPKDEMINLVRTMYKNKPGVNVDTDYFALVVLRKLKTDNQDPAIPAELEIKKVMLETCPKCDAPWKWQEVQAQSCESCGYPNVENDNY